MTRRNLVRAAVYGELPGDLQGSGEQECDGSRLDPNDDRGLSDPAPRAVPASTTPATSWSGRRSRLTRPSMQIQRPFLETPFEYLVEVNGSWQDERWADPENLVKLTAYALLDMRARPDLGQVGRHRLRG